MKIEVRSDGKVHIEGYVNAVCRDSRPMLGKDGKYFVEQVEAGCFRRALEKGNIIPMHNHERAISPFENLILREDAIGLYASFDTNDPVIRTKAENKEFRGWSFGFSGAKARWEPRSNGCARRYISEMNLHEISLIDTAQLPCYVGTTVEVRSEPAEVVEDVGKEIRAFECEADYLIRASDDKQEDPKDKHSESEKDSEKDSDSKADPENTKESRAISALENTIKILGL